MNILAFDPYLSSDDAKRLEITRATVDEIAEQADFITVHTLLHQRLKDLLMKTSSIKLNLTYKSSTLLEVVLSMKMP